MLYLTHSLYAIGISLLFGPVISLLGFSEMNYYLMLITLAVFGKEGAKWPDCDHKNWNSVKEKTPFYWMSNKIIILTGGKHRSRHTHTLDVCLLFLIVGVSLLLLGSYFNLISKLNSQVALMYVTGFGSGWFSHLIADSFNSDGIYIHLWSKKKSSLVGDGFKMPFSRNRIRFRTGGDWEAICQAVVKKFNWVVIAIVILFGIYRGGAL